jgi:hypothetical protein
MTRFILVKPKGPTTLRPWERLVALAFGAAAIAFSLILFARPQTHSTQEFQRNHEGNWTSSDKTEKTSRVTEPLAVLALGAIALLFALNGRRLYRFSVAGTNWDTDEGNGTKQQGLALLKVPGVAKKLATEPESETQESPVLATSSPAAIVEREGEKFEVYSLNDLPTQVLGDALSKWPKDDSRPGSVADFKCALRKGGRGNHPWLLQFKGKRELWVSYGGKGKEGPTVAFD